MAKLTSIYDENGNLLVEIDALVSLDTTSRNSLSKYKAEQGSVITENVAKDNLVISLQGVISKATPFVLDVVVEESPLRLSRTILTRNYGIAKEYKVKVSGVTATEEEFKSSYVQDARKTLQSISDNKRIVELTNAANSYPNLIMVMLSFRKDSALGGDAIRFDAKFEQITYATPTVTDKGAKAPGPYADTYIFGTKESKELTEAEVDGLSTAIKGIVKNLGEFIDKSKGVVTE